MSVEIVQLLVSPVHRYEGRPADGPLPAPPGELVDSIEIRAGLGVVGDRYFGRRAHRDAAVTIIAAESLPPGVDLVQTRRNILLRGADVDALVGLTIALDSGTGPVSLRVHRPANPCAWLDVVVGPGTRLALRGKGGVRCEPLTDGRLRVGPVTLDVTDA
jgi:MOSC domain-containing protein YiiM